MAEYLVLSDVHIDPTGCARAWMYIGMAMKLAHSVSFVQVLLLNDCLSLKVQIGLREHCRFNHCALLLTPQSRPWGREIPARATRN